MQAQAARDRAQEALASNSGLSRVDFVFIDRQPLSRRSRPAHDVNNKEYEEKGPKSATHIHAILRSPTTL